MNSEMAYCVSCPEKCKDHLSQSNIYKTKESYQNLLQNL